MKMSEQIAGFIRHTLTLVGGIAVAKGLMDEQTMLEGVGILMSAIGYVWSFKAKDSAK